MNCRYSYAQVSSKSQELNSSLTSQKEELMKKRIPESNIYEEIGLEERKIFSNLIENILKKNDLLMVTKIDRWSRNTLSFLKLQDKLFPLFR